MITKKHLSTLYKIYAPHRGLNKTKAPLHELAYNIDQATPKEREQLAQRILNRVSSERSMYPTIAIQYAHLLLNWDTTYT